MKSTHRSREVQQIKLLAIRIQRLIEIVKSKKLAISFEPSMKILSRILKIVIDNGPKGRTSLSLDANLNYERLAKHLVWLEQRGMVKSIIEDDKINFGLTEKGRAFASMILYKSKQISHDKMKN
ncbi:MAG: winged helix-turn-helix domain-containing protein [Nitrosotalea sp.]